jgi:hypothetical protein
VGRKAGKRGGRAPLSKSMLLPLPRKVIDDLSLRYHMTLRLLSSEVATEFDFANLSQLVHLTLMLVEEGVGEGEPVMFEAAQKAIDACSARAKQLGHYRLEGAEYSAFAAVLTLHDSQLGICSVHKLDRANERLHALLKS